MDNQKINLTILGCAGGVVKSILSLFDKSFEDVNDPIHTFISSMNLHLVDQNQKKMEYYGCLKKVGSSRS
ncbi:hypothetical protein AB4Z29_25160 [Paenibacillus sp. 2TAB23]|uniref:hypothetical protein n=1 Tax=Paenibacillus sp. 2TAB23 TaxID=3233004 RepID=UPI003F972495